MKVKDKVVVVTGGGRGIGQALCRKFAAEGAKGIVVSAIRYEDAVATAEEIGGHAVKTDVAAEEQIKQLVAEAESHYGPIDLFCSNAGISLPGGLNVTDKDWERIFSINFHSHLYAARAVVPGMIARGGGYLLNTVSAAGVLTGIGSAPYSVTKHAARSLAEWLSVTYGDQGIGVSIICPQGVLTKMLLGEDESRNEHFLVAGAITPDQLAETVIEGLDEEWFLILPHEEVQTFFERKANDYDRWLRGMRRLQNKVFGGEAPTDRTG